MAKLEFPADNVRADTEAEANIAQIVNNVANSPDGRFLLTRNGDPSVVIVNVDYIENLLGDKVTGAAQPAGMPPPPPPFEQPAAAPNVSDFMSRNPGQPMPPQEVQEKPPLEPPAASDFQPLISPPLASDMPEQPPAGPMPGPNPFQTPPPPGPSGPGNPLPPPPPMPPPSSGPTQPGPPYLGGPQQ